MTSHVIPGDEQLLIQGSPSGTWQIEVPHGGVLISINGILLFARIRTVVGQICSVCARDGNGGRGVVGVWRKDRDHGGEVVTELPCLRANGEASKDHNLWTNKHILSSVSNNKKIKINDR